MLVCSAFKSFSFLSAHTASYLYPVLSISFPLPLFRGLLCDRAIVCVWGCVDKREPVSTWETALWLTVGGCRLQGLSLWLFCSGSAHFLGRVSTWAPSVCAFYFLSRGSRPSKLIKCQRERDGQERVSALGLDRPTFKSFLFRNQLWHPGKFLSPFLKKVLIKTTSLGFWEGSVCQCINMPGSQCL